MAKNHNTWTLILAGGEGRRLHSLTRTASGMVVPKQYCSLRGGPSLLEQTLRRARQISLDEHVCAVVTTHQERWWQPTLALLQKNNILIEPMSRGTAVGILLGLLHIAETDADAQVVLTPSDHYVQDDPTLMFALRAAESHVRIHTRHIVLLGMEPERPDPELGYIVPATIKDGHCYRISNFVEKPSTFCCATLIDAGAMWNAFIIVAKVSALIEQFTQRYPAMVTEMRNALQHIKKTHDSTMLAECYLHMPCLDFSRHILEAQPSPELRVLPVAQCGWSDLGTPQHVIETLQGMPYDDLERDLRPGPVAPVILSNSLRQQHAM